MALTEGPHGLRLERLPDQTVTGWKSYEVLVSDRLVGRVVEVREWQGWRYGGRRWEVAHTNGRSACWRSGPVRTRREAVEALVTHLDECGTVPSATCLYDEDFARYELADGESGK